MCVNGMHVYITSLPEVPVVTTMGPSKLLPPQSGYSQNFMEPEVPLSCFHRPVTCSYPQTHEAITRLPTPFL